MLAEIKFSFLPFFAIEHPGDIVPTIVGLVLLVWLLNRFVYPAAKSGMADRATRVETDIRQVDAQLEDVARLRNDYATRIQQIEREQRERIDVAVRDADNARAEIIADAQATATLVRRRGEEELARERTRQRILLRQQMVQLTLDAAEQAVRTQNTDAVQRQLIRHFIGQVSGNGAPAESFYPAANQPAKTEVAATVPTVAVPTVAVPPVAQVASATALLESEAKPFTQVAPAPVEEFAPAPEMPALFVPETAPAFTLTSESEPDLLPEGAAAFGIETLASDFVAPDDTPVTVAQADETGALDFTTPNFSEALSDEIPDFGTSETEGGA